MLFAIAMDYLPVQVMSVPCERIFLSAKEMDTNKRNKMSPVLMEALQLLKFTLKKEHLSFMQGWAMPEADLHWVSQPTEDPLSTLFIGDPDSAVDSILKKLI